MEDCVEVCVEPSEGVEPAKISVAKKIAFGRGVRCEKDEREKGGRTRVTIEGTAWLRVCKESYDSATDRL